MTTNAISSSVQNLVVSQTQMAIDLQMLNFDIWGTRVHVIMLESTKIIPRDKAKLILAALDEIEATSKKGEFKIDPGLGAQLTLEKEIVARAGEDAGLSTHTARSRNDQVMLTEILFLRSETFEIVASFTELLEALLNLGMEHIGTVMPGYTHMQPGKPTTFAHWCLAYHDSFLRANKGLQHVLERYDLCPLGAAESFGTSWPIDRNLTATLLGFESVWEVPQDAISSRGFFQLELLQACHALALVGSKMASDLLLYSTFEYGMVTLGDKVAQRLHPITGSSIMPQKRNPDVLELIRAIEPQLAACVSATAGLLSSLPSGYNRDPREVKEWVGVGITKIKAMQSAIIDVINSVHINSERMSNLVIGNYSLATELADALAQRFKLPYRKVYKVVGEVVQLAMENKKNLAQLDAFEIETIAKMHGLEIKISQPDLLQILDPQLALERRKHIGGTNSEISKEMFESRAKDLADFNAQLLKQQNQIDSAFQATKRQASDLINNS